MHSRSEPFSPVAVAFVGDELAAAGYRLAGALTIVAEPAECAQAVATVMGRCNVLLLGERCASGLPPQEREALLTSIQPIVVIVPPMQERSSWRDAATRARQSLGLEAEP
jgi:vacuolar-type H+-ATPase subunit F/Vma7